MKRGRLLRLIAGALVPVAAAVTLVAPGVRAQSPDDEYGRLLSRLQQTKRLVAEAEKKERALRKDIANTDRARDSLQGEIAGLQSQLGESEAKLDAAQGELAKIQQQLNAKTEELDRLLAELQRTHDLIASRASQVYKQGPASFLSFVLGALDFRDLVSRLEFVSHVFRTDDRRLETIRTTKQRITDEREAIERLREEQAAKVAVVERERNRVAGIRNDLLGRRRALDGKIERQEASLEHVLEDKETYLRQQRELEQESARIASFLRGRRGGQTTVRQGGMVWPTSGPVTSGYGWRTHPIFGTRRFHAGIDIGAPSGQSVVASAGGEVIYAGGKGGYGSTVIVDHGGGVATLYAHLSSIGASVGSQVGQGKFIGRVGCSGYCTGPHLHFEVRVNGEPQDPMRWLP